MGNPFPHSWSGAGDQCLLSAIHGWVHNPLILELDDEIVDNTNIDGLLAKIDRLMYRSEEWDFRRIQRESFTIDTGERARWLIQSSQIPESTASVLKESIKILGLQGVTEPSYDSYDLCLVLGGALQTCFSRVRFWHELYKTHNASLFDRSVFLTALRPISESETRSSDLGKREFETEFDAMIGALEQVSAGQKLCNLDSDLSRTLSLAGSSSFQLEEGHQIDVVAANSVIPGQRATTEDNYRVLRESFDVAESRRILIITSEIYVPYQHLDALRMLSGDGAIVVDTIGFKNQQGGIGAPLTKPENYLQEIRSTVLSIARILGR